MKKFLNHRLFVTFLLSLLICSYSRGAQPDSLRVGDVFWSASATGGASSGKWAPYLIGSNSGGRHAMKNTAMASGLIFRDYDLSKRFSWTAGAEAAAGYQAAATYDYYDSEKWSTRKWHPARAMVYQLWAGIKFRGVMLWAGARDHVSPLVDDFLSSGDMVLSNNARAIPQLMAGFVDYQNIPFTQGWVQIAGSISYGKYTDSDALKQRYNYWNEHIVLGELFTYKRIHFRTRTDRPLSVIAGVQCAGEFGGTYYRYSKGKLIKKHKNGQDLRSFWEMFIPTPRYSDGFVEGNHVGSWDFKARYRLKNGIDLEGYFQWLWEDGSSMGRRNMTDGLWGVGVVIPGEKPGLKKIIAEYIDMRDQSGPIHWAPTDSPGTTIDSEATGGDNYYNNTGFNAWANYGLGLGSPFPKAPLYNSNGFPQFEHNRTRGLHIAATGYISSTVGWLAKFSHAVAWGPGRAPSADALKNTSALVSCTWDAQTIASGLSCGLSLAFDAGKLRGNNFGALLHITYSGNFSLTK